MAELFDDEGRRVLIDDLVDRDHGAHIEQHLDDLVAFGRQAFREVGY